MYTKYNYTYMSTIFILNIITTYSHTSIYTKYNYIYMSTTLI